MISNIYQDTYLQLLSNSNKIDKIKKLILENIDKLSMHSLILLNKLLIRKNKSILLEEIYDGSDTLMSDVLDNIESNISNNKHNHITKLNELITKLDSYYLNTDNISDKTIEKIYNVIFNAVNESETRNLFNLNVNEKDINDAIQKSNEIDNLNKLQNYFNTNIEQFQTSLKTAINNKLDIQRNKNILNWNEFSKIFKEIINHISCQKFLNQLRTKLVDLSYLTKTYTNSYIFKKEKLNELINNDIDKFKTLFLDIIQNIIPKIIIEYNKVSTRINKTENIYDLLLVRLDPSIINDIKIYKNILANTEQDFNKNFYNNFTNNVKILTRNSFLSKEETKNINNNKVLTKLPYFPFEAIKILYPLTFPTSSAGGQAELLLSILLPGGAKPTNKGDILINDAPCEVKNLNDKNSGAKLNGQKKEQKISIESNKSFLSAFLNTISELFKEKISNINIENIDDNKFINYIKNELDVINKKNDKNIAKYNIAKNKCIGFIKLIEQYMMELKNLNYNFDASSIKADIFKAFNDAFTVKYKDNINQHSTYVADISKRLSETFNIDISTCKATITNLLAWHNYFGTVELKCYLTAEGSKYFICTYLDNDIHILLFNVKFLISESYDTIIALFNNNNITFNICDFSDAGAKCACSIKLMK